MKKGIGTFLIGAGIVGAIYYALKGKKLLNLIIQVGEIAKMKVGLNYSTINLNLYITNPNDSDLVYNQFYGTILLNGSPLANVTHSATVKLPGKNVMTSIKNIQIKFSSLDLIDKLLDVVKNKSGLVTLTGTLVSDKMSYPVSQDLKLEI